MSFVTAFLMGIIVGLIINIFSHPSFGRSAGHRGHGEKEEAGEDLATKEDIRKIEKDLEEIKNIHKEEHLEEAQKEFLEEENERDFS